MSRRIARIYISGKRRPLQLAWNAAHPDSLIIAGSIALDNDSPAYEELRFLYARLSVHYSMEWRETVEVAYSHAELGACKILTLWVNGSTGQGGNANGRVYEEIRKCPRCSSEILGQQVASLRLNPDEVDDTDLAITGYGELVCTDRFYRLLNDNNIPNVTYRPIVWVSEARHPKPGMRQLFLGASVGSFASSVPVVKEGFCQLCGQYRNVGLDALAFGSERQLRFPAFSYQGYPIALTQERFGSARKFSLIVINQKFYRLLQDYQMTGYWVEPAYLE